MAAEAEAQAGSLLIEKLKLTIKKLRHEQFGQLRARRIAGPARATARRPGGERGKGGPIIEAACWAHGRRKFFDLARLTKAPIAAEAIKRIDVLFAIEREINGLAPEERLRVRQERSRHLIVELEAWLREQRAKLSI